LQTEGDVSGLAQDAVATEATERTVNVMAEQHARAIVIGPGDGQTVANPAGGGVTYTARYARRHQKLRRLLAGKVAAGRRRDAGRKGLVSFRDVLEGNVARAAPCPAVRSRLLTVTR